MSGYVRLSGSSFSTLAAAVSKDFIIALSKSDGGPFLLIVSIMLFVSLVNDCIPADSASFTLDYRSCCESVAKLLAFATAFDVVSSRSVVFCSTTLYILFSFSVVLDSLVTMKLLDFSISVLSSLVLAVAVPLISSVWPFKFF